MPTPRHTLGGPLGGCQPRRSGNSPRTPAPPPPIRGVKRSPRGEADGEYLAGSIPVPQRRRRRVDRDVARRLIPPQWFWARRHDRQCLGVDHHRYLPHHQTLAASTPCCGPNSDPGVNQTLKGGSRLRTAVLPPLPARGALAAIAGQRDHPYRISLRRRSQFHLALMVLRPHQPSGDAYRSSGSTDLSLGIRTMPRTARGSAHR